MPSGVPNNKRSTASKRVIKAFARDIRGGCMDEALRTKLLARFERWARTDDNHREEERN